MAKAPLMVLEETSNPMRLDLREGVRAPVAADHVAHAAT